MEQHARSLGRAADNDPIYRSAPSFSRLFCAIYRAKTAVFRLIRAIPFQIAPTPAKFRKAASRLALSRYFPLFSALSRVPNIPLPHITPARNRKGLPSLEAPSLLVGRGRLELPTNGLKVRCSTD